MSQSDILVLYYSRYGATRDLARLIAEGIESALSLAHGYTPVWATIDAGHLAKFPVLGGIEVLVIGQDNDLAGIKAASQCAARWVAAGRKVHITQQTSNDVNDELKEAA